MNDQHQESSTELFISIVLLIGIVVVPILGVAYGIWCWFYCG